MATQEKDKVSDFKRKPILDAAARLHESEVARLRKDREDLAVALGAQHAANLALGGENERLRAVILDYDHKKNAALNAMADRNTNLVLALRHAEEWMSEDGCDCGIDEPGTCGLCVVREALR